MHRYIEIVHDETKSAVRRFEITKKSPSEVEKTMSGITRQMNQVDYSVK